ncbi:hypothetical protein Tco_0631240 [Tanacetum coccineum]
MGKWKQSELKVIINERNILAELKKDLHDSKENGSFMGEILSIRKILDAHFHCHFSKYNSEDKILFNFNEYSEKMLKTQISVRTLYSYCSNFFGVCENNVNGSTDYVLIDKDADWIRNYGQKGLHTDGKRVTIDGKELAFAILSYWQSEFLYVGMKVLVTLEGGLQYSKSNGSVFHQGAYLLYMFDFSKFLLDCKYLNVTSTNRRKLKRFLKISLSYFDLVFPLDWRNLVSEDLVPLRKVHLENRLLEEIILHYVDTKEDLTYWTIGRVIMICFVVATIQEILDNREDTISWIQRSKIDSSYYPLLVLKLATLLSIICLKVDHAEFLLDLLSGRNNISCFLPKKFVGDLLRKREDKKLNLDIEVVAESFLSINDPLVIVSSANATPKIAATCALFVDLRKSKDEIVSILFPRKHKHIVHIHSGAIPEVLSLNTLADANMNMNSVELQMNWKVLDKISEAMNGKKGVALSKLSGATIIKGEVDKNIGALATFFEQQAHWLLSSWIKSYGPTKMQNRQEVEHLVLLKNARVAMKELQITRPKIDKLLNHYVTSQTSNVEEPGDEELVVLENQSQCDNTHDSNKKGKGNSKGKKSNKSKGRLHLSCLVVWKLISCSARLQKEAFSMGVNYQEVGGGLLHASKTQPTGLTRLATKGVIGEVVTTCERSQVRVSPWGFSFKVGICGVLPHRCVDSKLAGTTFWVCIVESNH